MNENTVDVIVDEAAVNPEEAIKAYNKYGIVAVGGIVVLTAVGAGIYAIKKFGAPKLAKLKEKRADRKDEKLDKEYTVVKDVDAEVVE